MRLFCGVKNCRDLTLRDKLQAFRKLVVTNNVKGLDLFNFKVFEVDRGFPLRIKMLAKIFLDRTIFRQYLNSCEPIIILVLLKCYGFDSQELLVHNTVEVFLRNTFKVS